MKKWMLLTLVMFLLGGCVEVTTVSLSIVENAPKKVEKTIHPDVALQLIEKNEDFYYIVYRSVNDVRMLHGSDGNAIRISIWEEPADSNEMKTYIYKLTKKNASEEYVRVYINDDYVPFDVKSEL
ncbi:MAG: hypothetical protein ACI33P_12255 [Lysinibacillus sp.]